MVFLFRTRQNVLFCCSHFSKRSIPFCDALTNVDFPSLKQLQFDNVSIISASKAASTNYCKDSLNDASINQDLNSKHVIKVSRKDLRPLSEEELSKRTKKSKLKSQK